MEIQEALSILKAARAGGEFSLDVKLKAFTKLQAFREHLPRNSNVEVHDLLQDFEYLRELDPDAPPNRVILATYKSA